MDRSMTSTAFPQGSAPMGTSTSAPPHQSTHHIPQSMPYTSYMPSPLPGQHPSQSQLQPTYQSLNTGSGPGGGQQQSWDRLAIESNLQDYNQVRISPDLVAPIPPASYFRMGNDRLGGSHDYLDGMSMPVTSGSRHQQHQQQPQPQHQQMQQQQQQQQQHQGQSPYGEYPTSTGFMSAPPFPVQAQMSPHSHSMSTSNRSSPSNLGTQPATPQVTTQPAPVPNDMIWQSPFTPAQRTLTPAVPLPRHAQSQPLLRHPSGDPNTPYSSSSSSSFQNIPMQTSNINLTASPSSISQLGTPAPIPGPAAPMMMGHPQSQSYPGANRWPGDMMQHSQSVPGPSSSSSHPGNVGRPVMHSAPIPSFSQPLSRSSSSQNQNQNQNPWTAEHSQVHQPLRLDQIPTSFPPAPTLSKRSRSPYSQNSSPQEPHTQSHSHSQPHSHPSMEIGAGSGTAGNVNGKGNTGPKRPKLSVSMSMSVPNPSPAPTTLAPVPVPAPPSSQGHSEDDGDKKPIIACHTCRARKLK